MCAFWLGARCFGLEVNLVGEVVNVSAAIPVPLARPSLLGLFNLRGTPVALVDLAATLELTEALSDSPLPPSLDAAQSKNFAALVIKTTGILAAARIDRMKAVLHWPASTRPSAIGGMTLS